MERPYYITFINNMRLLTEMPIAELAGRTVLLRSGFNVPLDDAGNVTDDLRIKRALASIRFLKNAGARTVILGHIGRDPEETLLPVVQRLQKDIPEAHFIAGSPVGTDARIAIKTMHDGDIVVLENVRSDAREGKGDMTYAMELASLGTLYVGDAFPDSHRAHSSITGIPSLIQHCMGIALADEVRHLTSALAPHHPSLAVVAGAKFETKEPLIRTLIGKYSDVFVGGALANDLLKARGYAVGASMISDGAVPDDVRDNPHVLAPIDVCVERAGVAQPIALADIQAGDVIVDIGPLTSALLKTKVSTAQFVVWNGPLGWYEKGYTQGSRALAVAIAETKTQSIIGGGDTVAAIETPTFDPEHAFTFVSAGGGAMLEFMLEGRLPGIDALK
jgi:phosphoglycerate kinase